MSGSPQGGRKLLPRERFCVLACHFDLAMSLDVILS
jgi:hypothetical protein